MDALAKGFTIEDIPALFTALGIHQTPSENEEDFQSNAVLGVLMTWVIIQQPDCQDVRCKLGDILDARFPDKVGISFSGLLF